MSAALLLIDVINSFEFEGAETILPRALEASAAIAGLRRRAKAAGVPVLYVNDNYGDWRSDFNHTVKEALNARGGPIAARLEPEDDDYFVLKPKNSGFYGTPLELLLAHLEVQTVILTGFASDICVLYTASDAHMRGFEVMVPQDCVAAESEEENSRTLELLARTLSARVLPAEDIDLAGLQREGKREVKARLEA
ncbi:MAG: cysteine hydrolase [Deinococcota bacterium]|jgi:nicotinamidase-related amidase|nr:cysteine hydrolase [Deinococcota bacterium]